MAQTEQGKRKQALKRWSRNLNSGKYSPQEAIQELFFVCDEIGLEYVVDKAIKEDNRNLRKLYIEAIGRVPTPLANQALCAFAVQDQDPDLRDRAMTLLRQEHYNKKFSVGQFSKALRYDNNQVVNRGAFAIGELGSTAAIMDLIGALETTHTSVNPGSEPGRMSLNFGDGGTGMSTGGGPRTSKTTLQNQEALTALTKITDQDFGYDAQAWKNWYLENYTIYDIDVRRDE